MRPLKFWSIVAAFVFGAMTILWAFGDEPTGVVAILASVMWWGSALVLIVFGLIAIWRFRRDPAAPSSRGRPARQPREPRESGVAATTGGASSPRRTPALSRRSSPSTLE
jgi:hypothetical protein